MDSPQYRGSFQVLFAASMALIGLLGLPAMANAQPEKSEFNANHVVGHSQCVDCHRSEYVRWSDSKHATRAYDLLRVAPSSAEYAKALGIEFSAIAKSSVCVECHATPSRDRFGQSGVIAGVSCESCHNPAGGPGGWLNSHAVYGIGGIRREEESESHYERRVEICSTAGQLRSVDTYALAKRCFECHIVGNEALVNDAEHPAASPGNFDFAEKSLGEVRHNFHLDQSFNSKASTLWKSPLWHGPGRTDAGRTRLMFVVGALADLEVSLRNVAKATDPDGDYFEAMADRVIDTYELIEDDILDAIDADLPLLQQALEAVEEMYEKLDEEEYSIEEDKEDCLKAADELAKAATEFSRTHDGSKLSELDEPEVPEDE